jgi:CoA:oxalate CoA-transferase
VGSSIGDIGAGLFTTIGVLSALYLREQTGRGSYVDVAMLDCQVAMLENAITRYVASKEDPGPLGSRHPSIAPFQAFAVADGHIVIAAGNDTIFVDVCEALSMADLATDPRFATNESRAQHVDELQALLEARLCTQPGAYWLERLLAAEVPCAPINKISQVLSDPQVQARNMVVSTFDPVAGEVHMAGNPIKISGFEDPTTRQPAPDLDGDREHILRKL